MATPTSGDAAARQNGTAKSGRKRKVASQAGVNRYHKPIGSEIGGPRDANHAAIQQDQGARKNYGDLIGGDPTKQRAALDGMSTEDLNKLADISFSFKSSDPKVVALRIAARNAQARRGIHVKVGQTQTNPTASKVAPTRGKVRAMSNDLGPASARLVELAQAAEQKNTSKLGNFPIPDVNHLRKAISAIGRAKPEHRPIIARHIIARASKLNATHLISDHIRHYARGERQPGTVGMARGGSGAVELAGRWKHGWIPLDGVAHASKMKGGKGKPWWEGGSAGSRLHGSPKSGSARKPVTNTHKVSAEQRAIAKREGDARRAKVFGDSNARPDPKHEAAIVARARQGSSGKLTKVVKSGSPKAEPRGAAVNKTEWKLGPSNTPKPGEKQDTTGKSKLAWASDYKTPADVQRAVLEKKITPQQGNTLLADLAKKSAPKSRTIPDKPAAKAGTPVKLTPKTREALVAALDDPRGQVPFKTSSQGELLRKNGLIRDSGVPGKRWVLTDKGRAEAQKAKGAAKAGTTDANKVSAGTPAQLASKYLQMHGADGVRTKIRALEARKSLTAKDRAMLAALRNVQAEAAGPGKA